MLNKKQKFGLRKLEKDKNDFPLGAIVKFPLLTELPEEFVLGLPPLEDQTTSDFCGPAGACALLNLKRGKTFSFPWLFAAAKQLSGEDVDSFGLDLRTICKTLQKVGVIETTDAPYTLNDRDPSFLRRIENWPSDLFALAAENKIGSYFQARGPYDAYDDIRSIIWKYRNEKSGVLFGVLWHWSLSQVEMDDISDEGEGHALAGIGWTPRGMFIQNSYGPEAGENGRHYFSREVINKFADEYGAFLFHDMQREDAEYLLMNGIKPHDNWIVSLLKVFKNIFN